MKKTLITICEQCGAIRIGSKSFIFLEHGKFSLFDYENSKLFEVERKPYLSKECFDEANPDWIDSSASYVYSQERAKLEYKNCKGQKA